MCIRDSSSSSWSGRRTRWPSEMVNWRTRMRPCISPESSLRKLSLIHICKTGNALKHFGLAALDDLDFFVFLVQSGMLLVESLFALFQRVVIVPQHKTKAFFF